MVTRILAIDDSRTMRSLISAALGPAGYEVHLASDGAEGLAALAATDPALVITDINMPILDGFGVIDGVRRSDAHADIPVLVLTTECSDALKTRARHAGASGWIVKPFDEASLLATISRVLGR